MSTEDRTNLIQQKVLSEVHKAFSSHVTYTHGILMYLFDGEIPELLLPYPKDLIEKALIDWEQYIFQQTKIEHDSSLEFQCLEMYVSNDYSLKEMAKTFNKLSSRDDFVKFFYINQKKQYSELIKRIDEETE